MNKGRYKYVKCADGVMIYHNDKYIDTCRNFEEVFRVVMYGYKK